MFTDGQTVWVSFKEGTNKFKANIIAIGEQFTCVSFPPHNEKEIVANDRLFPLDYKLTKKHPHAELMLL